MPHDALKTAQDNGRQVTDSRFWDYLNTLAPGIGPAVTGAVRTSPGQSVPVQALKGVAGQVGGAAIGSMGGAAVGSIPALIAAALTKGKNHGLMEMLGHPGIGLGSGIGGVVGAAEGSHWATTPKSAYDQGFIDRCAQAGIDPVALSKSAARGDMFVSGLKRLAGQERGALLRMPGKRSGPTGYKPGVLDSLLGGEAESMEYRAPGAVLKHMRDGLDNGVLLRDELSKSLRPAAVNGGAPRSGLSSEMAAVLSDVRHQLHDSNRVTSFADKLK